MLDSEERLDFDELLRLDRLLRLLAELAEDAVDSDDSDDPRLLDWLLFEDSALLWLDKLRLELLWELPPLDIDWLLLELWLLYDWLDSEEPRLELWELSEDPRLDELSDDEDFEDRLDSDWLELDGEDCDED